MIVRQFTTLAAVMAITLATVACEMPDVPEKESQGVAPQVEEDPTSTPDNAKPIVAVFSESLLQYDIEDYFNEDPQRFIDSLVDRWVVYRGVARSVDETRVVTDFLTMIGFSDEESESIEQGKLTSALCIVRLNQTSEGLHLHLSDCSLSGRVTLQLEDHWFYNGPELPDGEVGESVEIEGIYSLGRTSLRPIPFVTPNLRKELQENALRFDRNYLGKWVGVVGVVQEIEKDSILVDNSRLYGLPLEEILLLSVGEPITAVCKVKGRESVFRPGLHHAEYMQFEQCRIRVRISESLSNY